MKFIFLFIIIIVAVVFLNPYLTFWMVMILIAILTVLSGLRPVGAFFTAGFGLAFVWLGQSFYWMLNTSSPLADLMGELMGVGDGMILAGITAGLGFLLGGFSGLTGSTFRDLFRKKLENIYRG
jgi:energy-coupling factor transporter transmembrane protein EcfT